jgi:hypothetical protein
MGHGVQVCLSSRCFVWENLVNMTVYELRETIIDLWNTNNGWIPGADYKRLAAILDVDPDRLIHLGNRKEEK